MSIEELEKALAHARDTAELEEREDRAESEDTMQEDFGVTSG